MTNKKINKKVHKKECNGTCESCDCKPITKGKLLILKNNFKT